MSYIMRAENIYEVTYFFLAPVGWRGFSYLTV